MPLRGCISALAASLALAGAAPGGAVAGEPAKPQNPWWSGYDAAPFVRAPDGRRFKVYCIGSRGPTVILEAGMGDGASVWRRVQTEISHFARACSYDRSGLGRSDPSQGARDIDALAADLGFVVRAVGQNRPVVLVGHSLGGAIVRQYAYRYPKEVAGLVLIDSMSEHQTERFRSINPSLVDPSASERWRRCGAFLGLKPVREDAPEFATCVGRSPADAPPDLIDRLRRDRERPERWLETASEWQAATQGVDDREIDAARHSLGKTPMIILTAADTGKDPSLTESEEKAFFLAVYEMHNALAGLSTDARRRVIAGSNHYIQTDRPQAVVEAIADVVADVRSR